MGQSVRQVDLISVVEDSMCPDKMTFVGPCLSTDASAFCQTDVAGRGVKCEKYKAYGQGEVTLQCSIAAGVFGERGEDTMRPACLRRALQ